MIMFDKVVLKVSRGMSVIDIQRPVISPRDSKTSAMPGKGAELCDW